jgi:hypothetical protein
MVLDLRRAADVGALVQCCFGVKVVLQWRYTDATVVSERCHSGFLATRSSCLE